VAEKSIWHGSSGTKWMKRSSKLMAEIMAAERKGNAFDRNWIDFCPRNRGRVICIRGPSLNWLFEANLPPFSPKWRPFPSFYEKNKKKNKAKI
jgi:hypothetical protein